MQIKRCITAKKILMTLLSSFVLWTADGLHAHAEALAEEWVDAPLGQPQQEVAEQKNFAPKEWSEFHAVATRCKMHFPTQPEHVSQKLTGPEPGYDLNYDAYISALDERTVFMLLVAQYPDFVDGLATNESRSLQSGY
jgi:hypothetical protein